MVGKAESGRIWEISLPPTQFGCEPKTDLKNKVYFKNTIQGGTDMCQRQEVL